MSRRESRDSETKRLPSKPDRKPSPKKPRRDGKPATERTPSNHKLDVVDHTDRDQKHHEQLQDALPLEAPLAPKSKVRTDVANKELDNKTNRLQDGTKRSSDPTEVPRSQSYFQHDERSSAGKGGQGFIRGATTERGWRGDSKDQSNDKTTDKVVPYDMRQRYERTKARVDENSVRRHDGFFELEAEPPPPAKRRPAFREKKMLLESEPAGITAIESVKPNRLERPVSGSERKEERGGCYPRDLDRPERPFTEDRGPLHRGEIRTVGPPARERFHDGSALRGRDKFSGRRGERYQYRPNSNRVEKWKHDLFDEANRSPTPKIEEDQIAKVEALLAL